MHQENFATRNEIKKLTPLNKTRLLIVWKPDICFLRYTEYTYTSRDEVASYSKGFIWVLLFSNYLRDMRAANCQYLIWQWGQFLDCRHNMSNSTFERSRELGSRLYILSKRRLRQFSHEKIIIGFWATVVSKVRQI